jgi:hypothetical protein
MNLQKFKLQAGIQDNPDQEGLDLFAQLIVEECMAVARRNTRDGSQLHNIIKQHFDLR